MSYTDTLNGTIIDNNTGLEWEKKSDDGTIHDRDTTYAWEDAFDGARRRTEHAANFAGHSDWRLPNVKELQSIVNYQYIKSVGLGCIQRQPVWSGDTVRTVTVRWRPLVLVVYLPSPAASVMRMAREFVNGYRDRPSDKDYIFHVRARAWAACSLIIGSFDPLII